MLIASYQKYSTVNTSDQFKNFGLEWMKISFFVFFGRASRHKNREHLQIRSSIENS